MSRSHVYFAKGVKPSFTKYTLVRNDRLFPDSSIFYPIFSNFSNTLVKYSGSGAKTMTGLPSLGW